jgi:hypothetical protein
MTDEVQSANQLMHAGSLSRPGKVSEGVASSYGRSIRRKQERGTTHGRRFARYCPRAAFVGDV